MARMPNPIVAFAGLLAAGALATGCGNTCYTTCSRLYQDPCNLESPGQTTAELLDICQDSCLDALDVPGEVGAYDPYQRLPGDSAIELENDRQAALWMDCVSEMSCENLDNGYCMPVW